MRMKITSNTEDRYNAQLTKEFDTEGEMADNGAQDMEIDEDVIHNPISGILVKSSQLAIPASVENKTEEDCVLSAPTTPPSCTSNHDVATEQPYAHAFEILKDTPCSSLQKHLEQVLVPDKVSKIEGEASIHLGVSSYKEDPFCRLEEDADACLMPEEDVKSTLEEQCSEEILIAAKEHKLPDEFFVYLKKNKILTPSCLVANEAVIIHAATTELKLRLLHLRRVEKFLTSIKKRFTTPQQSPDGPAPGTWSRDISVWYDAHSLILSHDFKNILASQNITSLTQLMQVQQELQLYADQSDNVSFALSNVRAFARAASCKDGADLKCDPHLLLFIFQNRASLCEDIVEYVITGKVQTLEELYEQNGLLARHPVERSTPSDEEIDDADYEIELEGPLKQVESMSCAELTEELTYEKDIIDHYVLLIYPAEGDEPTGKVRISLEMRKEDHMMRARDIERRMHQLDVHHTPKTTAHRDATSNEVEHNKRRIVKVHWHRSVDEMESQKSQGQIDSETKRMCKRQAEIERLELAEQRHENAIKDKWKCASCGKANNADTTKCSSCFHPRKLRKSYADYAIHIFNDFNFSMSSFSIWSNHRVPHAASPHNQFAIPHQSHRETSYGYHHNANHRYPHEDIRYYQQYHDKHSYGRQKEKTKKKSNKYW